MKHGMKRTLAALLAAVMVFTSVDITGLAAGTQDGAIVEAEADEGEELLTSDGDGTAVEAEAGESAAGTEADAEEASGTSEAEAEEADEQEAEEETAESAGTEEEIVISTVETNAEVGQYAANTSGSATLSTVGTYGELALIAEYYGTDENGKALSDGEKAILKSDALSENETTVTIQAYDKGALLSTADGVAEWGNNTTLYLKSYTTDDGTTWYPVSVSDGSTEGLSLTDEGSNTWSLEYDGDEDSLTVTYSADYPVSNLEYELNIPSELQDIVGSMAAILEGSGAAQKLYEDRTDVNKFFDALNDYGDLLFQGSANEWAIDAIQECMSGDALRLYTWLNPIASAASPVAAYCSSANAASICSDAETLAGALEWLRTDATNWANMLDFAEDYGVTATSVENLITYLKQLAGLSDYSISDYLKTDAASNDVALLIAAVQAAGIIDSHTESATSITVTREYTVVTPGNATVTVNLVVDKTVYSKTKVITFDPGEKGLGLTNEYADPDTLISELETSFNDGVTYLQDEGTIYYELKEKSDNWSNVTTIEPDEALTFTKTYSSQSFNVYVEGETEAIANFETGKDFASYSFTLPYVLDENGKLVDGYYYTYESSEVTALDGKESGDVATISRSDLVSFGDDYSLTISRSIHNEETDTYENFVADVNESLKDAGVSDSIVLLMQTGEDSLGAEMVDSIVLRLSPSSSLTVSDP